MDASAQIIDKIAQTVREYYDVSDSEMDFDGVVRKIGGKVAYSIGKRIFDDCDIIKEGNAFYIEVPEHQSAEQHRVSVACGIGYLFMYMSYLSNRELWDSLHDGVYFPNIREKKRIRMFAAAFLMPAKLYKEALEQYTAHHSVDISMVAKRFQVPIDIAVIRGRMLGLLNW